MTVTMEINNHSVLNLLRDLESLKFIRLSAPIQTPGETAGGAEADWFENGGECPLCAIYHEPNEESISAAQEIAAMERGEIPMKRFHSLEELLADLRS